MMKATTGRWMICVCFFVGCQILMASQNSMLSYVEPQAVSRQTETPFGSLYFGVREDECPCWEPCRVLGRYLDHIEHM